MSKTISGATTQFLYDGLNPVQELNSSNGVVANLLTGLRVDEYFARTDTSTGVKSTLLADAVGSTIGLVTSNNGPIATNYTYQPFGATTVGGSASGNSYQFTGRENDGTGLYFYRARYYSPTFQRFVSQDPLGFAGESPNLYGYAFSRPTNLTDPLGLSSSTISVAAGIGAGVTWGTNPDGSPFWSVSLDVGAGGGYTYRPNGTSPGYSGDWTGQLVPPSLQFDQEACRAPGSHLTIGPQTSLGVSGGPLSIDTNTELGIDLGPEGTSIIANGPSSPEVGLNIPGESISIGSTGSVLSYTHIGVAY